VITLCGQTSIQVIPFLAKVIAIAKMNLKRMKSQKFSQRDETIAMARSK
jgi:hypothetical protein